MKPEEAPSCREQGTPLPGAGSPPALPVAVCGLRLRDLGPVPAAGQRALVARAVPALLRVRPRPAGPLLQPGAPPALPPRLREV
ncbi:unnamed protein product, partial [Coccothraustes coccothraustes]